MVLKSTENTDAHLDSYLGRGITHIYWNVAFYNPDNKQSYLLTNKKMMILSYDDSKYGNSDVVYYRQAENGHVATKSFRLYRAIYDDFDKNGTLDENDPVYLFVSDINGKNFKRLSPRNMSVIDLKVSDSKVYLTIKADADADKAFTDKDKSIPYISDLKTLNEAAPVFEKDFDEATDTQFKRLWVTRKK